jgi:hypothetical protein
MAPTSVLTAEDKAKVKKVLASSKVVTATVARVYQAKQGQDT